MTKEDAIALINALNRIQPNLTPLLFEALANNIFVKVAAGVANGTLTCTATPVATPESGARTGPNGRHGKVLAKRGRKARRLNIAYRSG